MIICLLRQEKLNKEAKDDHHVSCNRATLSISWNFLPIVPHDLEESDSWHITHAEEKLEAINNNSTWSCLLELVQTKANNFDRLGDQETGKRELNCHLGCDKPILGRFVAVETNNDNSGWKINECRFDCKQLLDFLYELFRVDTKWVVLDVAITCVGTFISVPTTLGFQLRSWVPLIPLVSFFFFRILYICIVIHNVFLHLAPTF